MRALWRVSLAGMLLACLAQSAPAGVYVGVRVGGPYCYRPYPYYYGYPYYRPYVGVVVAPPPVVVAPAPVVVQPAPVYAAPAPAPAVVSSPSSPEPVLAPAASDAPPAAVPVSGGRQDRIDGWLGELRSPDENRRIDAAMELGRLKAHRATGPLIRVLKEDASPPVRDAAARSLGLIGDHNCLAALQLAAQSDADRDVRKSASFSAEVIRGRLGR